MKVFRMITFMVFYCPALRRKDWQSFVFPHTKKRSNIYFEEEDYEKRKKIYFVDCPYAHRCLNAHSLFT